MNARLHQHGRASIDFNADLRVEASRRYTSQVNRLLASHGLNEKSLAEDLDERSAQIESILSHSSLFRLSEMVSEWHAVNHGKIGLQAFEEISGKLIPQLDAVLSSGPCKLERNESLELPAYYDTVSFHRTEGGWEGHPYMGYVHGELVHACIVAKIYPGGIYEQRRQVLNELPGRHYSRILDMGCHVGHYTKCLAEVFPEAEIHGVDLSLRQLEQCQRVANERGFKWQLYRRPAEDTLLEPDSFDLVTSYVMFHELPADIIHAVFKEAFRLLKSGGDLLMTDVVPYRELDKIAEWRADHNARYGGEPYWREVASLNLMEVAKGAGFTNARSYGLGEGKYPYITIAQKP